MCLPAGVWLKGRENWTSRRSERPIEEITRRVRENSTEWDCYIAKPWVEDYKGKMEIGREKERVWERLGVRMREGQTEQETKRENRREEEAERDWDTRGKRDWEGWRKKLEETRWKRCIERLEKRDWKRQRLEKVRLGDGDWKGGRDWESEREHLSQKLTETGRERQWKRETLRATGVKSNWRKRWRGLERGGSRHSCRHFCLAVIHQGLVVVHLSSTRAPCGTKQPLGSLPFGPWDPLKDLKGCLLPPSCLLSPSFILF